MFPFLSGHPAAGPSPKSPPFATYFPFQAQITTPFHGRKANSSVMFGLWVQKSIFQGNSTQNTRMGVLYFAPQKQNTHSKQKKTS
jgi:hypothetical protein